MKYRFIDEQRNYHRVEKMAEMLGVSRVGYYAWKRKPKSGRARSDEELAERIRRIQKRVHYRYGSPRMTKELARQGYGVGHNHVARCCVSTTWDGVHGNDIGPPPTARTAIRSPRMS